LFNKICNLGKLAQPKHRHGIWYKVSFFALIPKYRYKYRYEYKTPAANSGVEVQGR
jgi:hypothetical protein